VEARQWLGDNRSRLPLTRTHRTRSGGLHLLFRPHPAIKCNAGKLHPHIDTPATGGHVVSWPAERHEGLHRATLSAVANWIVDAFRPKPSPTISAALRSNGDSGWLRGLIRVVAGAPEGQRNQVLFWAACRAGNAIAAGKTSSEFASRVLIEAAVHAG